MNFGRARLWALPPRLWIPVVSTIPLFAVYCEYPKRINEDPLIEQLSFCGPLSRVGMWRGILELTVQDGKQLVTTAFLAESRQDVHGARLRGLEYNIAVGDSICKEAESLTIHVKHEGIWSDWYIHPPTGSE